MEIKETLTDSGRISEIREILYDSGSGQMLDLYLSPGSQNSPVLLFFHGGAWIHYEKTVYRWFGRNFAKENIITVIPEFRGIPDSDFISQMSDCKNSIKWTIENIKKHGGDSKKIFISGHSSGAHISSLLALEPELKNKIAGVIAISGIYRLNTEIIPQYPHPADFIKNSIKEVFGNNPDILEKHSPINYTDENSPPFLILTGEKEGKYMHFQSQEMLQTLKNKKTDAKYSIISGKDHFTILTDIGSARDATTEPIVDFIKIISESEGIM